MVTTSTVLLILMVIMRSVILTWRCSRLLMMRPHISMMRLHTLVHDEAADEACS